jgi:hypothetical protein
MNLFLDLNAWLSAAIFACLMLVGWWIGLRVRAAWPHAAQASTTPSTRIEDAALTLFGLLLAFCFYGASERYEHRKQLLRDDAVAIGELASVGSDLEEPDRGNLRHAVREYVEQRLVFGTLRLDDARMPQVIADGRASLGRMWAIVKHAIATRNTPTVHTPLVNAFNGMTESHDQRLYGVRDHVPGTIVFMLIVFGVFTTFTMGRLHDQTKRLTDGLPRILSYVGLIALVFVVTIDLEQPRQGMLLVPQEPMQDLLASLQREDGP